MRPLAGLAIVVIALFAAPGAAFAQQHCVWLGDGNNNLWSNPANWGSCQNRAPQAGDSVAFPAGSSQAVNVNDLAGLTLGIVEISGFGFAANGQTFAAWHISGNAVDVKRLTADAPLDGQGKGIEFLAPVLVTNHADVTIENTNNDGGTLRLDTIHIDQARVLFQGAGAITVDGAISGATVPQGNAVFIGEFARLTLNDNSYVGRTIIKGGIQGGTVIVAHANAFGAIGEDNGTLIEQGATLVLRNGVVVAEPIEMRAATIELLNGAAATLAGPILIKTPQGASSRVNVTGTLTISGKLSTTNDQTFDGMLTQNGPGTVVVSNPSNDFARYDLQSGTLRVGAPGAIPAALRLQMVTAAAPATFDLNGFDTTLGSLTAAEEGQVQLGANTLTVAMSDESDVAFFLGVIAGTGNVTKAGPGGLIFAGDRPNTYTGATTVSDGDVVLFKEVRNGAVLGTLTITGGAVFAVSEQIADAAAVVINNPGSLTIAPAEILLMPASASGHLDDLLSESIGSLNGNGAIHLEGDVRLAVGANNRPSVFTGAITGRVAAPGAPDESHVRLVKVGTGTLRLSGQIMIDDRTIVESGTLQIDGTLIGRGVLVRGGGIVSGVGSILTNGEALRVTAGAISPGASHGVLHGDATEIGAGGALVIQLETNGPGPGPGQGPGPALDDRLDLRQNLTIAAGAQLVVTRGGNPPAGTAFPIITLAAGKTVTGTFAGLPEGATLDLDRQRYAISYHGGDGNDVVLTVLDDPPALTYFLSEGATGGFFDSDILIANPNDAAAPVTLTFSKENGEQVVETRELAPQSHLTVHVDALAGLEAAAASTQVTSNARLPLLVERTMFWDATYYAGHTGTAVERPAQDWYFAEGSQGFFSTFVLVINPNAEPADVTFTFFREDGEPVIKTIALGATTRLTLDAGTVPELVNRSFGISVHATKPIMAERSMYFGTTTRADGGTRLWSGGHESAGVTSLSTHWFLAEGATGGFFDTFVLLSNPQDAPANVTLQYLLDTGETVAVQKILAPHARLTTNIEAEDDPRLHAGNMSTVVTSDVPIIAERSMYWPGVATPWGEGHNSLGVADASTRWGMAEGRVGGPHGFHTYILLANPQTTAATVAVRYLRDTGAPIVQTYTVPATGRLTIDVNAVDGLQDSSFGAVIDVTNGLPIIVERSMYWDLNGVLFSGGTNATGIKLGANQ